MNKKETRTAIYRRMATHKIDTSIKENQISLIDINRLTNIEFEHCWCFITKGGFYGSLVPGKRFEYRNEFYNDFG